MNVKYTANEIYFDIIERMDCIFDAYAAAPVNSTLQLKLVVWCHCHIYDML